MTEPVTPNKGFTVPNTGDLLNAWGGPINTNFTNIDTALAGSQSISLTSGGTVTMTAAQAQFLATTLTGALSATSVFQVPKVGGFYLLNNASTGGYAVTCQTGAAGGAIRVLLPGWNEVFTDGTDVHAVAQSIYDSAPTIASGFGVGPTIVANNTAAFQIIVGAGGSAATGVITMPPAPNGWVCNAQNVSVVTGTTRIWQGASTKTAITLNNVDTTTGTSSPWTAGDNLNIQCTAF